MSSSTPVGGISVEFKRVPVISAAAAYTAEDQVGGIIQLFDTDPGGRVTKGAAQNQNTITTLMSLVVCDAAKQSAELVIFFFNQLPTVISVDNGAINIADSEMAAKCVGSVRVPAANYENVSASSVATVRLPETALSLKAAVDNGPLWAVMKTTGTPTYVSTSDLSLRFLFGQDLESE